MNRVLSPLSKRKGMRAPWHWTVLCSLLIHCAVFFGVWQMGRLSQANTYVSSPIRVDLVSGPSQVSSQKPAETQQTQPEEKKQVVKKAKPLFRKPKLDTKRDLVSIRPSTVKAPKPAPVEKKEEPPARRADVKDIRPEPQSVPDSPTSTAAGIQRALGAMGNTRGTRLSKEEDQYVRLIQERIGENWQAYLPPGEKILGQARIKIAVDGSILELTLLKGSGKPHIDASFVRALKRLVLPPPPRRFVSDALIIQFHG